MKLMFNATFFWWLSCQFYKKKNIKLARFIKTVNFLLFHAILPYEAEIEKDIELAHFGLGIVIHPNVKIGSGVKIYHNVTLATETWIGSPYKIIVEDGVIIGTGAIVIGRGDKTLIIGKGSKIGAGAVVTRDVLAGETVVGVPAKELTKKDVTVDIGKNELF